MAISHSFILLCLSTALLVQANPNALHHHHASHFPITARPLRPRQTDAASKSGPTICGYRNGDLDRAWRAPEGSTCFLDHTASYFGWCNSLLSKDSDCTDVPRACVDSSTCSDGCGKTNQPDLPTITCTKASSYCYSNLLVTRDETYTWLGCDLTRSVLIYSPAAGVLDAPSSASATPTSPTKSSSASSSTPTTTDSLSFGTSTSVEFSPNTPNSSTPTPAPASSRSTNAGAIAGGVVGGLAVLAIAGLVFFFLRRRHPKADKKEVAELGPPDYQDTQPSEKFAYHTELPGAVAASELPGLPNEPVELHGETTPAKPEQFGN